MMAQEDNKMEIKILCKWSTGWNKKWSTTAGRHFVLEKFPFDPPFQLHFTRLNRKLQLNKKRPQFLVAHI